MNLKNLIMWAIIVLLSVGLFNMFQDPSKIKSTDDKLEFKEVNGKNCRTRINGNKRSGYFL